MLVHSQLDRCHAFHILCQHISAMYHTLLSASRAVIKHWNICNSSYKAKPVSMQAQFFISLCCTPLSCCTSLLCVVARYAGVILRTGSRVCGANHVLLPGISSWPLDLPCFLPCSGMSRLPNIEPCHVQFPTGPCHMCCIVLFVSAGTCQGPMDPRRLCSKQCLLHLET